MASTLEEIIEKHFKDLRALPNVLNIGIGTKWKDGVDTGKEAIVVFVSKKKDESCLAFKELIPKWLEGALVDVIELSAEDFKMGPTSVSLKPVEVQKKIAGGVRK